MQPAHPAPRTRAITSTSFPFLGINVTERTKIKAFVIFYDAAHFSEASALDLSKLALGPRELGGVR